MKQILAIAALALTVITNQLEAQSLDGVYFFWGAASKTSLFSSTSSTDIAGSITIQSNLITTGNATIREYGGPDRIYNLVSHSIGLITNATSGPVTIDPGQTGNPITINPTTTSADATFTLRNGTDSWIYKGRIRKCSYTYAPSSGPSTPLTMQYLMGSIFNTASAKRYNGIIYGSDFFPWM